MRETDPRTSGRAGRIEAVHEAKEGSNEPEVLIRSRSHALWRKRRREKELQW